MKESETVYHCLIGSQQVSIVGGSLTTCKPLIRRSCLRPSYAVNPDGFTATKIQMLSEPSNCMSHTQSVHHLQVYDDSYHSNFIEWNSENLWVVWQTQVQKCLGVPISRWLIIAEHNQRSDSIWFCLSWFWGEVVRYPSRFLVMYSRENP